MGDNGRLEFTHQGNVATTDGFGILVKAETTSPNDGGDDLITAGTGRKIMMGGAGDDSLLAGTDSLPDMILGDEGIAEFAAVDGVVTRVASTTPTIGGDDTITAGNARNILIGGQGADAITGGDSSDGDVIIGDSGEATFEDGVLIEIKTIAPDEGGDDIIHASNGPDVVLGGFGKDSVEAGTDTSRDIVLGDNGQATFTSDGRIINIFTTDPDIGSDDDIFVGDGDDIVMGGVGNDAIDVDRLTLLPVGSDTGNDIMLGDNGSATFFTDDGAQVLVEIKTTDPEDGGDDLINASAGDDIVLGGVGRDYLNAGSGDEDDIVLGDNGQATFTDDGRLMDIHTTSPTIGGDDDILIGNGDDIVMGGAGDDTVDMDRATKLPIGTDSGKDIILGDNGTATYYTNNGAEVLVEIKTTDPEDGGDDLINASAGDDIVLGGVGSDFINAGSGDEDDIALGDNGQATFTNDGRLMSITTTNPTIGGDDDILIGNGDDIAMGGAGDDTVDMDRATKLPIGTDSGKDIILGDNGSATYYTDHGAHILTDIRTTNPEVGGEDFINASAGEDIVFGGSGDDSIDAGSAATSDTSQDIVLGDNGFATFNNVGLRLLIQTSDVSFGGDDTITTGGGDDIIIGGSGDDDSDAGIGDDYLLGDNGRVDYTIYDNTAGTPDQIIVMSQTVGGDDMLRGGDDNDIIIGGTADDELLGGNGHDVMFGDHAEVDFTRPVDRNAISRFITATDGGGNDNIHGNDGDDFLFGGQGNDELFGNDGQDDIIGGHNVPFGADGDDTIEGGNQEDVILGDNGLITRTLLSTRLGTWQTYLAPFDQVVIRDFQAFDDRDLIGGNDTIDGGAAMDILIGQRGDDDMHGGSGDDEIIGGLGADTINGDNGVDHILSDAGQIIRDFNADGTPQLNSNGVWHRDLLTEDIGRITSVLPIDPITLFDPPADLAQRLLAADRIVLASGQLLSGERPTMLTPACGRLMPS